MRQRDAVLKEAVEASITYCGRVDESFVLGYLVEQIAQKRGRAEGDAKPKISYGSWGPPPSERMTVGGAWIQISLPDELDKWMNVRSNGSWMALIPTRNATLSVETTGGAVQVSDQPYWSFVRWRDLAPIMASHGVAVSRDSVSEASKVLIVKQSRGDMTTATPDAARKFLMERADKWNVKEAPPEAISLPRAKMRKHIIAFEEELVRLYGNIAPNIGDAQISLEPLGVHRFLAAVARN